MRPNLPPHSPPSDRPARIVLAGANSQTGRLLSLLLRDSGVHTTALIRQPAPLVADHIIDDWTRNPRALQAMAEADAVVLLAGVFGAEQWTHYQQGMVDTAMRVAAAVGTHPTRVVYFSSLLADASSSNWYLRAKGLAEQVLSELPQSVIFRLGPVVRGSPRPLPFEQALLQTAPGAPVMLFDQPCRTCRPINLGDVATIAEAAALGVGQPGIFELGGPEEHSLGQLACLANGAPVPLHAQTGHQPLACDLAACLATPPDAARSAATAAAFGLRLTPLSLAWPLDAVEA